MPRTRLPGLAGGNSPSGRLPAAAAARLLFLAGVVLAVAAGPGAAIAGEAADNLGARPLDSQLGILGLEIRSAGHRCPDAIRLFYSGFRSGADLYTVRCSDNRDYLVQMRIRDGQLFGFVNSCGTARANYGLRCWRPIE